MNSSAKTQTGGAPARLPHFNDASIDLPALKELASHDQWVMWRNKRNEAPGKPVRLTKYPMNANNGSSAKVNERETWASFAKCYDGAIKRGLMGVGFVLDEADGFTGLDLDKCISDDGTIETWAAEIVALGETYCEVSPSRKGLHFFIRGKVDYATKCDAAHVELYGTKRFLTVTGWHVEGAPDSINPAPRTIQAVLARAAQFRAPDEREATPINREPRPHDKWDDEDPPYITFFRKDREEDDAKRARGEYVGWLKNAPRNDNAPAGGNFFRNVNDKACAETDRWAQALFPQAKRSGTGWRVSSKSLGRNLEEDISITRDGIVDFGVHDMGDANGGRRTPINLVMEWGGHDDAVSAARWLCDQMGVTPENLGWQDRTMRPEPRRVRRMDDGTFVDADTGEILGDADAENVIDMEARRRDGARTGEQRASGHAKTAHVEMETISAASLAGEPIPEQRWLIKDLIPHGNVTMLAGDGATGKSLLGLQLGVAVVTGKPWIGFHTTKGRVVFVSAEDETAELHRRLARIEPRLDLLGDLTIADLAGKDAVLAAPEGREGLLKPTALFPALERIIAREQPDLLILDTLADLFGGDEIKKVQARQFIGMLRGLALRYDLTVLLLSHPSQSGMNSGSGTSGNTAWNNSVRSRLYLERRLRTEGKRDIEDDSDLRVLSNKKANRASIGGQILLRWKNGKFEREAQSAVDAANAARHADSVFLALLEQFTKESRNVSPNVGPTYAPKQFSQHPNAKGVTKSALARAMDRLLEAGRIAVEDFGSPSKPRQRLVIVAQDLDADVSDEGDEGGLTDHDLPEPAD